MTVWQVPTNWYWQVQDSSPATTRWQSSTGTFVTLPNADFTAFLAAGFVPTSIDTFANLCQEIDIWNYRNQPPGRLAISSGVNYQMANTPPILLDFTPTASGLTLTLPAMNVFGSLAKSRPLIIHNLNDFPVAINNFSGFSLLGALLRHQFAYFFLTDNSTQGGSFDYYQVYQPSRTTLFDANATLVARDAAIQVFATSVALSAPRTATLPAASNYVAGTLALVSDDAGGVTATNTLSVARAGSDTINGGTASIVLNRAYAFVLLETDGVSQWTIVGGKGALASTDLSDTAALVRTIKIQTFTASGTYTPSAGMLYCLIEAIAGGGAGGAAIGSANNRFGGGGGGSGGRSSLLATAATIGASKTVTIGAGGTGGTGDGGNGGDTSVGSLCIAKGGTGGKFGSAGQAGTGGAGGVAGTGDVKEAGNPGGGGVYMLTAALSANMSIPSGFGGGVRGGGATGTLGAAGNNASNYGGGGGGAENVAGSGTNNGGSGAAGFVSVIEFCSQ